MFLHLSDTHLGYADFAKVDSKTGFNQREVDVYRAFEWMIDYALQNKPEFIIHAGDLFDTTRPPNRIISFALRNLKKLSKAKIPTVLLSGKTVGATSVDRTDQIMYAILSIDFPRINRK